MPLISLSAFKCVAEILIREYLAEIPLKDGPDQSLVIRIL